MTDEERHILAQAEAILRKAHVGIVELDSGEAGEVVAVMHAAKFGSRGRTLAEAVELFVQQWGADIEEQEKADAKASEAAR